jgi:hypothetical protein
MKTLITLLLSLSLSVPSYGNSCSNNVTVLEQGAKAPCKGYLFSPDEESRVYKLDQDNKILQDEVTIKNEVIDTYKKDISDFQTIVTKEKQESEIWRKSAVEASEKLISTEQNTRNRDLYMILLGVVLTGVAGYSVHQLNR